MSKEFDWDDAYKGTILSVFFIGYTATQLVGGTLADKYGGKSILAIGVIAWSLFTFLTPLAAASGTAALVACRILMGVGEGVAFPAIHSIISANVPLGYQSSAVAVVTAASYAGAAAASGLSPWLIDTFDWPMVFYVFGVSAVLWLPFWALAPVKGRSALPGASRSSLLPEAASEATDTPAPNWRAGRPGPSPDVEAGPDDADDSAALLTQASAPSWARDTDAGARPTGDGKGASRLAQLGLDAGFLALLNRREVWAICAAQYCQSWGMYALLNWLPTFFSEQAGQILHAGRLLSPRWGCAVEARRQLHTLQYQVDITDLGKYTLVPPLVQAGVGAFSGVLADTLIVRGYSVKTARRALQVAGMLGPAACLLLAVSPAVEGEPAAASVLVTAAQGFSALTLAAVSVSQLDIAPKHAGAVFGLGNTSATLSGLASTQLTGQMLAATHSWSLVFSVTAGHYVIGAALWYAWLGDAPLPEDDL